MTFKEYQEKSVLTDVRPEEKRMTINGFGLMGEFQELNLLYAKGRMDGVKISDEDILGEVGDILWYISSITTCLEADLEEVANKKINKAEMFTRRPIAESFKKVLRDNNGVYDGEYREDILYYLTNFISELRTLADLEEAMEKNIEKLSSRYERGEIQGDGSDR